MGDNDDYYLRVSSPVSDNDDYNDEGEDDEGREDTLKLKSESDTCCIIYRTVV